MLNTKSAYKVLANILACEKLVCDSFWEDDEDRLPDLPKQISDYKCDLFYSVLAALNVSVADFCDELNGAYSRDYVLCDYGRIAAFIKGGFYCFVDENMLELLHSYVFERSFEDV